MAVQDPFANNQKSLPLPHQNDEDMQRKEKYLKSKGIKTHKPTWSHAFGEYKYDRTYVASHWGDANFVPFSRSSRRSKWVSSYEHPNRCLRHYLERYFCKQVGRDVDDVFRGFGKLGWNHLYDMYYYWEYYVDPDYPKTCYQIDDDGRLTPPCKPAKHKYLWYWNTSYLFDDDDDDDEYYKPVAKRPRASDKRLTRKELEHNEKVIAANNGEWKNYIQPRLLGEFFIERNHKVVKCEVYLTQPFYLPQDYVPVKILGIYNEEFVFHDDAEDTNFIPCMKRSNYY